MGRFSRVASVVVALLVGHLVGPVAPAGAVTPTSVTVAGSLQSELGCPGDWQPDCAATHLTREPVAPIWSAEFAVPAGNFDYKVALNDTWEENYGAGGVLNGPSIPLSLAAGTNVRFYFDEDTHWIADNVNEVIATVVGSFLSELGCPGDWQPDCLVSLLEDLDGDGVSTFVTTGLPPGSYEAKVAHDESWSENYGAGGVAGGANIPFVVPAGGAAMTFTYDEATHVLTIGAGAPPVTTCEGSVCETEFGFVSPGHPTLDEAQAFTVPAGVCAVTVEAVGGSGGDAFNGSSFPGVTGSAGVGGSAVGTIEVTPGEVLEVRVGGQAQGASGGFNGGGAGRVGQFPVNGALSGGGGGASDVRRGGSDLVNRVFVAGGGGGGGAAGGLVAVVYTAGGGGSGGGLIGSPGGNAPYGGGGGTATDGGAPGGIGAGFGIGGVGGTGAYQLSTSTGVGGAPPVGTVVGAGIGGGGGGGWYGGGGGGLNNNADAAGGGGGGSGYGPAGTVFGVAAEPGSGSLTITYDPAVRTCPIFLPPPPPPPPPAEICNKTAVTVDLARGQTPTNGPDVIRGTTGDDIVNALGGDDIICSLGGDDIISGNQGQDRAFGGGGDDEMRGNSGNDILRGRAGDDLLYGQAGNDTLDGGANTDTCRGGTGTDTATACEATVGVP